MVAQTNLCNTMQHHQNSETYFGGVTTFRIGKSKANEITQFRTNLNILRETRTRHELKGF